MNFRSHAIDEGELAIELTPLIDVVFLLLIFFMVSSTFKDEAQLALVLPESSAEAGVIAQAIDVVVSADGLYHIDGRLVAEGGAAAANIDVLKQFLKLAAGGNKEPAVVIAADRNASHGAVVKLLEAARQLNYLKISFTAERTHSGE
ncbi:MAG: biopolymer transporter ExbD [Immundisolibacteraceae bacterium]|nr:biopolymer transporter ExbD [Immundisolibacteraceae bacterium]